MFARLPLLCPIALLYFGISIATSYILYLWLLDRRHWAGEWQWLYFIISITVPTFLLVFLTFGGLIQHELRLQLRDMGTYLCLNCGYDIRNLSSQICPECGIDDRKARPRYPILVHILLWLGLLFGGLALVGLIGVLVQGRKPEWTQFAPLLFWSSIGINCLIRLRLIYGRG